MVAEALAERWQLGRSKERFRGAHRGGQRGRARRRAAGRRRRPRVAVLCPQTYMNDAGRSVGPARGAFKLPLERVLVVHDEIDLPFGEVRTPRGWRAGRPQRPEVAQARSSAARTSCACGSASGRPDSTDPEIVSAYVLGRFRETERAGRTS